MKELVLYSKPGCHLCDEMKRVVERVRQQTAFALREIDVSVDPELMERYGEEIPVLFVDDRKAFKYRVTERELRRRLER